MHSERGRASKASHTPRYLLRVTYLSSLHAEVCWMVCWQRPYGVGPKRSLGSDNPPAWRRRSTDQLWEYTINEMLSRLCRISGSRIKQDNAISECRIDCFAEKQQAGPDTVLVMPVFRCLRHLAHKFSILISLGMLWHERLASCWALRASVPSHSCATKLRSCHTTHTIPYFVC